MEDAAEIHTILAQSDLSRFKARDLFVPCNETFKSYHDSEKKMSIRDGLKGNFIIRQNEAVKAWRYVSGMPTITSETLLPVGILIMMYNDVFNSESSEQLSMGVGDHPIAKLIYDECDLMIHRPSDMVPFATVLGKDVFQLNNSIR